jgi:glucose-1-phosphate adenylyltransferase
MPSLDKILAVIMGGGRGARLYPLTRDRAKPAVPIAGKYRLIDIPISNCINSGIHNIAVLTQFNSVSLHRHITQTYNFDAFHRGYVQIWAAEQSFRRDDAWYQGTADAVRKQLFEIRSAQLGLIKRAENECLISDFVEKAKDPKTLKKFVSRDDPERPYIGSMGIYFFSIETLFEILESNSDDDFGGQVIPKAIHTHKVCGFDFDGFWEDIGTIRSFYEVNLKLASPDSPFHFHDPEHRIYSRPRFLPSTKVNGATLENVMIADGCLVGNAEIKNAVIGLRCQIQDGAVIRDTVLMGADYYDTPEEMQRSGIPIGIGENSIIQGALIDKNARIGTGVIIKPFPLGTEIDGEDWVVRDGIVVIPKRAVIPAGTVIAPEPNHDGNP